VSTLEFLTEYIIVAMRNRVMNKYLIIADESGKKQPAIHRGIELAKRSGAAVHVVAFVYDAYLDEQEDSQEKKMLQQAVIDARQKQIDAIINELSLEDLQLSSEVMWEKRLSAWVVEQVKADRFSMIIKTGHRTETIIYTPSDWQIFRESPVPVMVVAEKKWRQKNSILCAIDLGSKNNQQQALNRKIIRQGKKLAECLNAELFCCYAIPIPTVLVDLDLVDRKKIQRDRAQKAKAMFAKLADEFELDKASLFTKAGKAEKAIPSIANKLKTSMVVMGTVGRKGLKGKLMGNTAERVIHHLRTDLVAIKP